MVALDDGATINLLDDRFQYQRSRGHGRRGNDAVQPCVAAVD
ncbi:MAG: hypothetical protein R2838_16995 [Caldilineaceae bacterium]